MEDLSIVIGGGVGPMAGVALHALIVESTVARGDADHLEVIHVSRSASISDRSDFLRGAVAENPALGMAASFRAAGAALRSLGRRAVGGVPCNTFHAPAILRPFRELLEASGDPIDFVDMLEETLGELEAAAPGARRIGVLSTSGTRASGVYDGLLGRAGLECLQVAPGRQDALHRAIYDPVWGLKAASPVSAQARAEVEARARELAELGAEALVLGCTELPLALAGREFLGLPLVDPLRALARALIRKAAPGKLKGLRGAP